MTKKRFIFSFLLLCFISPLLLVFVAKDLSSIDFAPTGNKPAKNEIKDYPARFSSEAQTASTKLLENCIDGRQSVPILISSMGGSGTTFLANVFKAAGIKILHEAVGIHGTVGWWQLFNLNQLRVWERLISLNKSNTLKKTLATLSKQCKSGGLWIETSGKPYLKPCQKGDELYFEPYFPNVQSHPILYEMVFHQVRDPLKVISSFSKYCGHNQLWAMACSVTPELIPYWNSDQQKSTRYKHNFNTCTKLMMYHWVSWNKIISLHADWTYRIENTTLYSICSRAFKKYPTISEKCKSIEGRSEKLEIRRNSKQ